MRVRRQNTTSDPVRLPLSPMIDIIFLLLIFFVMTFQIVPLEGDLFLDLPPAQAGEPIEPLELPVHPPLHVRVTADAAGELQSIQLGDAKYDTFAELNRRIREIVSLDSDSEAADWEAMLEVDPRLEYRHTIAALTAISGYTTDQGQVVKLIEKVSFGSL